MRSYKLQSARERLEKTAGVIAKLGRTMNIRVSPAYHRTRLEELDLTADYLAKVEEEKERVREERERERERECEEAKARREFEAEKAWLLREQSHYEAAIAKLEAKGDLTAEAEPHRWRCRLHQMDARLDRRMVRRCVDACAAPIVQEVEPPRRRETHVKGEPSCTPTKNSPRSRSRAACPSGRPTLGNDSRPASRCGWPPAATAMARI